MLSADVIVVGAGPTGLMLACELALAGVRCRVLERRAEEPNITRAFAVHARTLELLDARGLAGEVLLQGVKVPQVAPVPGAVLNLAELPTPYPMILIVPQSGTEKVLRARAERLGVPIVRGAEVVGLRQDDSGVELEIGGPSPRTERARYVVGCDGAHSAVRRLVGVDFVGKQYETHILLADMRLDDPPPDGLYAATNTQGAVVAVPFGDGWYRTIAWDRLREQVPLDVPVTRAEMADAFTRIAGTDLGMGEPRWSTRFLSERRQARRYRVGRVFLAGDAAHVHSPLGGQGMNTGIQDAMNLGWKLAAAVHGRTPAGLLDSYEGERHPVGARVLALTDLFNQLVLGHSRIRKAAQWLAIRTILRFGRTRRLIGGRLTGIGIAYPRPRGAHRWVGRRLPDLTCGGTRLYEAMRDGRFLLVVPPGTDAGGADLVHVVDCAPAAGRPAAFLVRPDGYVAWASTGPPATAAVASAVTHWCGAATQPVHSG